MAEDAVLKVGLDLSPAEASLNRFYSKLRTLQQKASEGGTASTKAIQLPRQLAEEVAAPLVPRAATSQGTSDRSVAARNKALQESVALQAKRVALLEREYRIAAQIAGAPKGEVDSGVATIRAAGRQGLSRSLGMTEVDFNKQFKNSFDRQIRSFQDQFKNLTIPQQSSLLRQQAVPVLREAGISGTIRGQALGNVTYDPFRGETEAAARNLAASTTSAASSAARVATATAQQANTSEAAATASAEALARSRAAYAKADAANAGAIDRAKRAGRTAPAAVVSPSVGEALQEPVFNGDVAKRTDRTAAIRDQARLLALKEEEFLVNERIAQNNKKIGRDTPIVSNEINNLNKAARAGLEGQIGKLNSTDSRVLNASLAKARDQLTGIAKLPLSEQAKALQQMAVNSEGLFAPSLASQGITGRAVAAVPAGQITPRGRTELRPGDVLNPDDNEARSQAVSYAISMYEKAIVEAAAQVQLQNAGLVRELAEATAASQLFSTELQLAALRVANGQGLQAATLAEVAVARAEQGAQTKEVIASDPGLRTGLVDAQGRALRADAAVTQTQAAEVAYLESVRANTRARLGLDTAVRTSASAEDIAAKAANQLAKQEEKAAVALAADTERNLRARQARSESRKVRDASGQAVRQTPQFGPERIDPTQRTDFDRLAQNRANAEKDLARVRREAEQSRIFSEAEARNSKLLVSGAVPKYNVDAPINLPDEKAIIKQQQTLLGQEIGAIKRQVANEEAAGTLTGQAKALLQQEIALREAMITELSRSLYAAGRVSAGTAGMAPYKANLAPYVEDSDPQGKAVKEANRKADEAQMRTAAARQVAAERQQQRLTAALNTPVVAGDDSARRQALASAGYSAGEQKRVRDRALREQERAQVAEQQRRLRRAATQEKDALLSGSKALTPYKASEVDTLQFTTEKAMLKEIQRQLRNEIESGKLTADEVKAREAVLRKLRGKLAALSNVERGTTPKSGLGAEFFEDDLAGRRAAAARLEASRLDPAYRQSRIDEAKRAAATEQVEREARARIAGTSVTPAAYTAATNFNTERMILKSQLAILNEMRSAETQLAQQNALDSQITQAKAQMKRLQQAENAAMGFGGNGPRPPGPTSSSAGAAGGGWFSRFTSKFRSGHQFDDPGSFFGRGALSSIQYGLPSMALYGAASGVADSIREAEELQYVFSKLEGQVTSTFGPGSQQVVEAFKQTIIDTAVESGLAADELGATSLKIFGTFSQRDIGGFEGPDLANQQVASLGKLQRVTGLTAKQLENDYSAISLAFDRTFENIGDRIVAVSDITGVDAGELGNFAGDISAVLVEAGFTLEESLALGAASAQNSGKSMSAISEAYGRVIPQLGQQTAKLNELASMSPALQTPVFLDAVRLRDGATILQEIGKQYNNLDKQSQTFLTSEIIGRREAQSVLPGLVNQEGYAKTISAQENADGDLDKRYKRVMQNLSAQLAKLGEEIRILFKELLEGGLGDFLQLLLTVASALTKLFGGIFSIVGGINDLTNGWLGNIILIAATLKGVSASMKAIAALQIVQNVTSGQGFTGTGFMPNSFLAARQGFVNARQGSPWAALGRGVAGPVLPGGQNIAGVGAGLRGGGSAFLSSLGGGSAAIGAGAIGVTAIAAAGLYIKSRIDDANAAVEEVRTEEESAYEAALAEGDTPQIRRELSDSTLTKAEDAARRQGNLNKVLAALFNVTTEEEALKQEAIRILLDPDTEAGIETLASTAAGREFLGEYFQVPDDLGKEEGEQLTQDLEDYAQRRAIFLDVRNSIAEAIKDADGRRRVELETQLALVDSILAGESVDASKIDEEFIPVGTNESYNPYGTQSGQSRTDGGQLRLPDLEGNAAKVKDALLKAGVDIGALDPKVRATLEEAIQSANPGDVLLEALNDERFDKDQQKTFQEILDLISDAAAKDPNVQAAEAAKDPVGAIADALSNLDNDYKNGLISAAAYARGKAQAAADLRAQMEIGDEAPDQETLTQVEDAEKAAKDALSELINNRLDADLNMIERYSTGNEELDFSAKQAAIESAIGSGALNAEALNGALDNWFSTQKDKLQKAIDDAETPAEAERIAAEGFEIPDYIRVASIRSYLDSLGVAWETLNQTFEDIFETSADAYISTLIQAVAAGETTIEAARTQIAEVIAVARAALQQALNTAKIAEAFPIFGIGDAGSGQESKDRIAKLEEQIAGLESVYTALGIADPGATQKGSVDPDKAKNDKSKAADARASYMKALANRNQLEIAQIDKAEAARKYQEAQALTGDERAAAEWEALEMDVKANQDIIAAVKNIYDAKVGYLRAVLEFNGDQIGSLEAEAIRIQNDIKDAFAAGDEAGVYAGLEAQVRNQEQIRQERGRLRDSSYGLFETVVAKDDPVAQLRVQEALAREQLRDAVGVAAKNDAQRNLIDIQRQLNDAMNEARYSSYSLRQAELEAMDEDAAAAGVAAELARQQLNDAIARGAGTAEINGLKAAVISADRAAADALTQEKLDDYKFLYDMGQITKSQYINYLEALKNTLQPGTDQFKELELQLRQLKNDISGDLQANLPTSLTLPTLYEVRRLNQIGGSAPASGDAGTSASIGYQDNRVQDIQITIGQNMSQDEIVDVLNKAIGTGRSGYGARRY